MKPRAMMIIHNFRPGPTGGAELQAERLAKALAAMGHEMQVLTWHTMPDAPMEEMSDGVRIHRAPFRLPYWVTRDNANAFRFLVCRRNTYDILHAHLAFGHAVMAVVAARILGKGSVIKIACSGEYGDMAVFSKFYKFEYALKILHKADAIVAISREVERELVEDYGFPGEIIHRIPNGVDAEYFNPGTSLRGASGCMTFIQIGRRHPQKGIDTALQAVRILIDRGYNGRFELHLYGEDYPEYDYRKMSIEAAPGAKVFFHPFVDDILQIYRQADALILPSRSEGLSNTLLEAMATGLPVIGTNVSGTPDVVYSERNGVLIPPDDPDILAESMARFIDNPGWAATLGGAARQTVISEFSLGFVAKAYAHLYENL
jgi:glycosyltransferase involved in cell wall biosynthesis